MQVTRTNNVKFGAGDVYLRRVAAENIPSYNAIKKIAEDKSMDIFITKSKETKFLPRENMFVIVASKKETEIKHGTGCAIMPKDTPKEELAVRIYNATMRAIDVLEEKLAAKK